MPPRKKRAPRKTATKKIAAKRKPAAAKKPARGRAKTRALAFSESVVREAPRPAMFANPFAVLEAMLAWSPARILATQQAAFWEGFAGGSSAPSPARRKRAAKRTG